MNTLFLVFLIVAQTSADNPKPGDTTMNYGTDVVLTGAPSQELAGKWADQYVYAMLLKPHREQKVKELRVITVHDLLLTGEGTQKIDWSTFPAEAWAAHNGSGTAELAWGTTILFRPGRGGKGDATTLTPDSTEIATLKKELGASADKYNWDPGKNAYYLVYTHTDAWVVKAMNIHTAILPLLKNKDKLPAGDADMNVCRWPLPEQYGDGKFPAPEHKQMLLAPGGETKPDAAD